MRSRMIWFEDLKEKPECRHMVDHYTRTPKVIRHESEPFKERFVLENGVIFDRYANGDVWLAIPDDVP